MITTKHVTADEVALIRTCVHEAAHAVVATVLGGAIHCASAAFAGGSTTYEHLPEDVAGAVAFAGPYAEAFWEAGTGRHPDPWQITAALAANRRDERALHASRYHGPFVGHSRDARTVAQAVIPPLIERRWPAVMRTAAPLFRCGEVTHSDICAALGAPASGNELALAALRRGAVPGWFQAVPEPVTDAACHGRH